MKKKSKLLIIGDNCFDITMKWNFKFKEDRNFIPSEYKETAAGTGVNFAVALSKFFGEAYYFTPVSTDGFGKEIEKFLASNNVKILALPSVKKTALIIVIINSAGARTTLALMRNTSYEDINVKEFKNIANDFEAVYISGGIFTSQKVQRKILKIAKIVKEHNMKLFFDPQIRIGKEIPEFMDTALQIAGISNIVLANKEEFEIMDLSQDRFLVEKKGNSGATVFYNSKKFSVKGIKVNVMDTSGAGDVFNAAFLTKYLNGFSIIETLKFANYAAALSVTKKGAYAPEQAEVENFIKQNG